MVITNSFNDNINTIDSNVEFLYQQKNYKLSATSIISYLNCTCFWCFPSCQDNEPPNYSFFDKDEYYTEEINVQTINQRLFDQKQKSRS